MTVFETTEGHSGTFSVKSVVSTDDGNTWGTTRSVVVNPSGTNNNGSYLLHSDVTLHEFVLTLHTELARPRS